MKTDPLPGETLVKAGPANMQRGIETVGVHLYLTNQRLVFESHRFNVQTGVTVIPRSSITKVEKRWTKFLNLIPLAPNSIGVGIDGAKEERFVVTGRKAWIEALDLSGGR